MKNKIDTIIFDIGGVLVDFRLNCNFDHIFKTDEVKEKFMKATIQDSLWKEFDRGVLSDEEIVDGFVANDTSIEAEIREVFNDFSGVISIRDFVFSFIDEIKAKGYKVYALSNMPKIVREDCDKDFAFLDKMDGYILSYEVKCIKPDREIYDVLLSKYNLKAQNCIFIDDLAENTKSARRLGFETITYVNYENMRAELAKKTGVEL